MAEKLTTEEFIAKARQIHGNKYSYEKSKYVNSKHKVIIICPTHGEFLQAAWKHTSGQECLECGMSKSIKSRTSTNEQFLEKAKNVHGEIYDYSLVDYVKALDKVVIICPIHGEFRQTPNSHLYGSGCPECHSDIRSKHLASTLEHFVRKATEVHGTRYSYLNFKYTSSTVKSVIACAIHGEFLQTPKVHTSGAGCPACAFSGYTRDKPGKLYVLKSISYIKIGITNLSAAKRAKQISKSCGEKFSVVLELDFDDGRTPDDSETFLLRELRKRYKSPVDKFDGYTECFIGVDLVDLINRIIDVVRITEQINNQ